MAEQTVQIDSSAGADELWGKVGDFAGIGGWFPGIDSCRIEGDVRVLALGTMEIREQLIERDEAARSITYSVIGGVPVESHRATVKVTPNGNGSTITWTVDVEPEEMLPIFADTYRQALETLAASVG